MRLTCTVPNEPRCFMLFSYCAAVAPRGTASNHQSHSRCNSIVAGVNVDVDDVDVDDVIVGEVEDIERP